MWHRAERLTLLNELPGDGCFWLRLDAPVFVRAGERFRTDDAGLLVEHVDGRRTTYPGGWETRRYASTVVA